MQSDDARDQPRDVARYTPSHLEKGLLSPEGLSLPEDNEMSGIIRFA